MELFTRITEQLEKLRNALLLLNPEQYTYKSRHLSNASVGGHTRHIIELFFCAVDGYATGVVDYENRSRNLLLEEEVEHAVNKIDSLAQSFKLGDKDLKLVAAGNDMVKTTYYRELVYNLEHVIHHLALIKVALIELNLPVGDNGFGMAYSTINYKNSVKG